jgi:hypothetical protein
MALLFTWRAASLMPSWLPLVPLGPLSSRGQPPGSPRTGSDAPDPWGRSNSACSVSPWHPRRQRGPLGTMRGPARAEGRPLSANRQTESPGRNGWCIFCGPRTLHRKIKRRRATFNGFLKTPPVLSRRISGSKERLILRRPFGQLACALALQGQPSMRQRYSATQRLSICGLSQNSSWTSTVASVASK